MAACGAVGRGFESLWAQLNIKSNPQHLTSLDHYLTRKSIDRSILLGDSIIMFRAGRMMTNTSLSPKPGIKCYVENNRFHDTPLHNTVKTTQESITKSIDKDLLWTGESVNCICSHHVEQHITIRDENSHEITIHCHGSYERCNCEDM